MVQDGTVTLSKKLPHYNFTDKNKWKNFKVVDLCHCDIFGEDKLFLNCCNRFTAVVTSLTATIISITNHDYERNFHRT